MKKTVRTVELSWESESRVVTKRRMTVITGPHLQEVDGDTGEAEPIAKERRAEADRREMADGGKDEKN